MIPSRRLFETLAMASALLALMTGGLAAQATPSADGPRDDRRVFVWRTGTDDTIDLEAVRGRGGFLGVGLLDLTPELRRHFGVPQDRGVMISRIVTDSPAARADLRPADIVTSVDGEALHSSIALSARVAKAPEGAELAVERWRNGERATLNIPIEVRVRPQLDVSPLIVRRIEIGPNQRVEVDIGEEGHDLDHRWVERVVETAGDSFLAPPFIEQLEALRRERNDLLEKLRTMEDRLEALEGELHQLHEERPD